MSNKQQSESQILTPCLSIPLRNKQQSESQILAREEARGG
jgi:hypothetical protein